MRQIKSFNVPRAAQVLGALFFALGLVILPFVLLRVLTAPWGPGLVGLILTLLSPLIYGVLGWAFGALSAFLYNIIAKQVGGIELEVVDSP